MEITAEKPRVSGWMKLAKISRMVARLARITPPSPPLPHLSARQVRDMGLDPVDVERAQLEWPSQKNVHPML